MKTITRIRQAFVIMTLVVTTLVCGSVYARISDDIDQQRQQQAFIYGSSDVIKSVLPSYNPGIAAVDINQAVEDGARMSMQDSNQKAHQEKSTGDVKKPENLKGPRGGGDSPAEVKKAPAQEELPKAPGVVRETKRIDDGTYLVVFDNGSTQQFTVANFQETYGTLYDQRYAEVMDGLVAQGAGRDADDYAREQASEYADYMIDANARSYANSRFGSQDAAAQAAYDATYANVSNDRALYSSFFDIAISNARAQASSGSWQSAYEAAVAQLSETYSGDPGGYGNLDSMARTMADNSASSAMMSFDVGMNSWSANAYAEEQVRIAAGTAAAQAAEGARSAYNAVYSEYATYAGSDPNTYTSVYQPAFEGALNGFYNSVYGQAYQSAYDAAMSDSSLRATLTSQTFIGALCSTYGLTDEAASAVAGQATNLGMYAAYATFAAERAQQDGYMSYFYSSYEYNAEVNGYTTVYRDRSSGEVVDNPYSRVQQTEWSNYESGTAGDNALQFDNMYSTSVAAPTDEAIEQYAKSVALDFANTHTSQYVQSQADSYARNLATNEAIATVNQQTSDYVRTQQAQYAALQDEQAAKAKELLTLLNQPGVMNAYLVERPKNGLDGIAAITNGAGDTGADGATGPDALGLDASGLGLEKLTAAQVAPGSPAAPTGALAVEGAFAVAKADGAGGVLTLLAAANADQQEMVDAAAFALKDQSEIGGMTPGEELAKVQQEFAGVVNAILAAQQAIPDLFKQSDVEALKKAFTELSALKTGILSDYNMSMTSYYDEVRTALATGSGTPIVSKEMLEKGLDKLTPKEIDRIVEDLKKQRDRDAAAESFLARETELRVKYVDSARKTLRDKTETLLKDYTKRLATALADAQKNSARDVQQIPLAVKPT